MAATVLCFIVVGHAAQAQAQESQPAVLAVWVKPRCTTNSCPNTEFRGSGVAIGYERTSGRLLVLTAAHVVREAPGGQISVYVGKRWQAAKVRALTRRTPDWDLALLEVEYSEVWPCLSLPERQIENAAEVKLCGYEEGLRWVCKRGLFGRCDRYWLYWNGATPREGTSGGAVTANGYLIAIVSGYTTDGNQIGVGQNTQAIAMFLHSALGYLPRANGGQPVSNQTPLPPAVAELSTNELKQQLADLRQELQTIKNRPITVEIFDPETGIVKSRSFPAGEPIRLKLPARRNSDAGKS
jgi:hypothetical protein